MGSQSVDLTQDGVLAAPGTAMLENGDVNIPAIDDYISLLVKNGVDGVFILGTLGEGMSLTVQERKDVAEGWVKYGKDRLKTIIVHVGAGNLRDTVELARHAGTLGVAGIACMSPTYFKPASEEVMVDYLERVASAAPDTPFLYYCINFMTGVYLNTSRVLELAKIRIPNFRGVKVSSRELPNLLDCAMIDGLQTLVGTDEQFLTALTLGVRVPILNGYLGNLFRSLREAYDKGDMATAQKEMVRARKLIRIRDGYGGGPAIVKAIVKCLGLDLGPVRLPLTNFPEEKLQHLSADLRQLGLNTVL